MRRREGCQGGYGFGCGCCYSDGYGDLGDRDGGWVEMWESDRSSMQVDKRITLLLLTYVCMGLGATLIGNI